jgi:hypothetical protein
VSTTPQPLNEPSFRLSFESQIADLPPEHQAPFRSAFNALTDIYQAFTAQHAQITSIQSSIASKTSSSTSASSSTTSGVTAPQAANIATQTIQTTLNKVNNQTGTSYTVQNSDYQSMVTLRNAAPVAVTLGGDGTGVNEQFGTYLENLGAGVATLTPANSATINGAATLQLVQNQGAIAVFDGTSWWAVTSVPGSGGTITDVIAGTGLSGGGSSGSVTVSLIVPVSIADGGTGTASTLTGLVRGSGSAMTAAEISGDATTSGSNALTLATGLITAATNGSGGSGVSSLNSLTGALAIAAGSGITVTPSGSNITIAATGGGGGYLKGSVTINFTGGAGAYLGNTTIVGASGGMAVVMCAPPTSPNAALPAEFVDLYADIDPSSSIIYCSANYIGGGSGIGNITFPLVVFP